MLSTLKWYLIDICFNLEFKSPFSIEILHALLSIKIVIGLLNPINSKKNILDP